MSVGVDAPQLWLPPQTALFACIYSMQRDPDYWPHALEFRPERWLPVMMLMYSAVCMQ